MPEAKLASVSVEHVETAGDDPRLAAIPDSHGHAKGEHKPFAEERPIPYTARMLFLWFYHACRRGSPRFMMVADHMNYLTFEDPAAVNLVRRALKLAQAGDLFGAAETAGVEVGHAEVVSKGLRRGMRYSIGAEVDNDPRSRPDAQNIVDAMKPDGMVRSVHFLSVTHPTHGENWMWAFDNPEFKDLYETIGTEAVWETYMATLLDAVEKLPGNIVGHFYVPAVFGHWPSDEALEGYEDKLVDACAERGMAIEINSRYLYKHYASDEAQLEKFRAVHVRLLRKAVAKGVAIAVGSDAHSPKDQGRAFDAVLALLDEVEINEIAFPIGGRLARVALRATEEFMKQFAPPEPEPVAAPEPVVEPAASQPPAAKAKKPRPSRAKVPAPASEPVQGGVTDRAATIPMIPDQPPPPGPGLVKHKPPRKKKAHGGEITDRAATIPMIPDQPTPPDPGPGLAKQKPPVAKKPPKPEPAPVPAPKPKPKPVAKKPAPAKSAKPPSKPPAKAAKKPAPKPAPKKAAAKKTVAKKKAAPAKRVIKKSAPKPVTKKTAKKAPAKKAAAKKSAVKKAPAKKQKPVAKKSASKPAKKGVAKKSAAKKSTAKKAGRRR